MIYHVALFQDETGREVRKLEELGGEGKAKFVGHGVRLRRQPGRTIRCDFHFEIPAENIEEAYRNWDAAIVVGEQAADDKIAQQASPSIQRVPAGVLNSSGLAAKPGRG